MADLSIRQRKWLPHWEFDKSIYFVTFRLHDSLPATTLKRIEFERKDIFARAKAAGRSLTEIELHRVSRLFRWRLEKYLDRGAGACYLAQPAIAKAVADALMFFDGRRYEQIAWCVMSNHVHTVFQPLNNFKLAEIVHSWKSFTATQANRILGRTGPFWYREYYDHLIRDDRQYARIVRYVIQNPVKAGVKDWQWVFLKPHSHGSGRLEAGDTVRLRRTET